MSEKELDAIVSDLLENVISQARAALVDKVSLVEAVAPGEGGALLTIGLATWALTQAAPAWLRQSGRPIPPAGRILPVKDRLLVSLIAARASETRHCVREARADMAALRRMGRV